MLYLLKTYLVKLHMMPIAGQISKHLPRSIWKVLRPRSLSYSRFIRPGDLVFDVGAHIGESTEIFLNLGARVICIEPQESCIKILKQNYKNNKNVTIVEKGLSDEEGTLTLSICEDSSMSSFSEKWKTGRFSKCIWKEKVEIPVITLDSLLKKFGIPKFCKIDVEGSEFQVLKGLTSKIRFIRFEFTKEFLEDAKLCTNYLSSLGRARFNFSLYAHDALYSIKWLDSEELFSLLESISNEDLCGDIYAELR